jgi:hypothetical protein
MSEPRKLTVALQWRSQDGVRTQAITCNDQPPYALIPTLVQQLALPSGDDTSNMVMYRLHLDTEQGPTLHSSELLSRQRVVNGSRLWLVPEPLTNVGKLKRCLVRLPDGSEIALATWAHELTRTWLMSFLHLLNPEAYAREVQRFDEYTSPYRYVSDKRPHCRIGPSEQDTWVIFTDRDDVLTEYANDDDYEPVPTNVFVRLDNNMRIRLGGAQGLELGVVIL